MKKNLEKIFASASIIIAIVLIMILVVTAFGGISVEEFDNQLVRGLIITLGVLYIALSLLTLVFVFINQDAVKEITMRSEQEGSVKVTLAVVKRIVKKAVEPMEGVKCGKIGIVTNEYGVRLRVNIRIKDKDVVETETFVRAFLEEQFKGALGFRFHAIEIKVTALQAKFVAEKDVVDAKTQERLDVLKAEQEIADAKAYEKEKAERAEVEKEHKQYEDLIRESADSKSATESEEVAQVNEIADDVTEDTATEIDADTAETEIELEIVETATTETSDIENTDDIVDQTIMQEEDTTEELVDKKDKK